VKLINKEGSISLKYTPHPLILCIPYSYNPEEGFKRSCEYVKKLRDLGFLVFSPILHNHNYHLLIKDENEDYYQWDLELYDAFGKNAVYVFAPYWESSWGCNIEYQHALEKGNEIFFIQED
jgi:hypothetical protein